MTRPLITGPRLTLIGVISMPIIAPPNIFVEPDLIGRAHDADVVGRIGADVDDIGVGGPQARTTGV